MTVNVLSQPNILQEVFVGLRNADIFTTTQRNVTTATGTATLAGATTFTISAPNVKNIRSVSVASSTKSFGSDYTVNYNSSGTCVITFSATQTGTVSVSYDYGTDKIFSGYPRNDIGIDSFPRIAVEFIDIASEIGGFGNVNQNRYDISVVVYDPKKEQVRDYIHAIRTWIIQNQNSLYYLKVIKPTLIGPMGIGEFEKFKDRIFQQNIDFRSIFNLEVN